MPIYEYRCASCGRSVEVVHSIHGTGPEACEVCGGEMRKALTTPAIVFKGSGWAKKDARSSAKPVPTGAGSKEGSTDASGSSEDAGSTTGSDKSVKDAAASTSSTAAGASGSTATSTTTSSGAGKASGSGDRSA